MKFTIRNQDVQAINESSTPDFPKYTSQLINWANQNAQGTRPKVVGQLSELFPEYQSSADSISIPGWEAWYSERYPEAVETATQRIYDQILKLQEAIKLIDKNLICSWVKDLVITKTYNGLYVQKAILAALAKKSGTPFRLAYPNEEAVGIDGYVGDIPYSVKPGTYKSMGRLPEAIPVKMIYYTKTKTGLTVEVEE
jgi:hypothetical protein